MHFNACAHIYFHIYIYMYIKVFVCIFVYHLQKIWISRWKYVTVNIIQITPAHKCATQDHTKTMYNLHIPIYNMLYVYMSKYIHMHYPIILAHKQHSPALAADAVAVAVTVADTRPFVGEVCVFCFGSIFHYNRRAVRYSTRAKFFAHCHALFAVVVLIIMFFVLWFFIIFQCFYCLGKCGFIILWRLVGSFCYWQWINGLCRR